MVPTYPSVTIVTFPAKTLVGLSVTSTMEKAPQDCPALWEKFVPRIADVSAKPLEQCGPSYGISFGMNMQTGIFTYMAAVESPLTTLPEGMERFNLEGGPYAATLASSLEQLGEAYTYIYGPWAEQQKDYQLHCAGACFELYDQRFAENGSLEVYVALKKLG